MSEVTHSQKYEVSYNGKDRTVIKRRRICRHCKLPFTTVETYESEEHTGLPEDITPFRQPKNPGVYCPPPSIPDAGIAAESLPPKKPQASGKGRRKT